MSLKGQMVTKSVEALVWMKMFNREVDELENSIEEWMFVLKNLLRLNDVPEALRTRYFESLFHKAEIAKLSKEKRKEYDQSVKNLIDMNALIAEKNREIAALREKKAALEIWLQK